MSLPDASTPVARTLDAILAATPGTEGCRLHHENDAIELWRGETLLQRLPTPVHPLALARVLGQLGAEPTPALQGGWQFDATGRQLLRDGDAHALTEKEALLLGRLLAAYPAPCTRDTLLKDVWSMQADVETHTLETHIYRLRHKLAELTPKPCDIVTVDSAYLLTMEPAE